MKLEPVFCFLAQEYRLRPTHLGALALYDVFCRAQSPAKISLRDIVPATDTRLASAIQYASNQQALKTQTAVDDMVNVSRTIAPQRYLYDFLAQAVQNESGGNYEQVAHQFDPKLPPEQSMPHGKMTDIQRHFVNYVWRPLVRPCLANAGFWQVAVIE